MASRKFPNGENYVDSQLVYVNSGYIISFFHVPTARVVDFKALITDFSDNYTSNWNEQTVYGRSDPIATYKNTTRQITMAWDLVAASSIEAQSNMQKVSLLTAMQYPTYSDEAEDNASNIIAPPLFKVSFTNLVFNAGIGSEEGTTNNQSPRAKSATSSDPEGLLVKMSGLNKKYDFDVGAFTPEPGIIFPKKLSLSTSFTVLHTHKMGWNKNKTPRNGFGRFPHGLRLEEGVQQPTNVAETDNGPEEQRIAAENKLTNGGTQ